MSKKMTVNFLVMALFMVFVGQGFVLAGEYPDKPVTLIIPVKPGGSTDMTSRVITSVVPTYLGQPIVLKFMPGAAAQIGTAAAARAKPDGYTLFYAANYSDQLQPLIEDVPYDTMKAFIPVCQTNSASGVLFSRSDKPWKNLDELIAYGKKNPGKLKAGHSGKWGPTFTPEVSLLSQAGIDAKLIPFKGGAPMLQAVLSGTVDFGVAFPSQITSLEKAGKVRLYMSFGAEREKEFPEVRCAKELGYGTSSLRRVVMVQRAIPADRLQVLRQAFAKMVKDKTYIKLITNLGQKLDYIDGVEYEKLRMEQKKTFQTLVNEITGK